MAYLVATTIAKRFGDETTLTIEDLTLSELISKKEYFEKYQDTVVGFRIFRLNEVKGPRLDDSKFKERQKKIRTGLRPK